MISVVGEVVADLVEQADGGFLAHPGGSPANVALALARLGHDVALLARFGPDVFARRARAHLAASGVGLAAAVDAVQPSTLAVASLDEQGRAAYDFWTEGTADWQWTDAELAPALGPRVRALHTGSLASWTPPGAAAVQRLLRRAHDEGRTTVSYDPNVRPSLLGSPESARPLVEPDVALAHVVKASDEDLAWLYPGLSAGAAASHLLALGPALVVVTLGADGALARRGADEVRVPAPTVPVADTVGAGDTFTAGLLHALAAGDRLGPDPLARLAAMPVEELGSVLRVAAAAAAVTCSRHGCDPPTAAELTEYLSG